MFDMPIKNSILLSILPSSLCKEKGWEWWYSHHKIIKYGFQCIPHFINLISLLFWNQILNHTRFAASGVFFEQPFWAGPWKGGRAH